VGPRLVSAFHLQHYKSKNAAALVRAARELEREIDGFSMDIVGDGPVAARLDVERLISRGGVRSIRLPGPVRHHEIQENFNRAAGFAMVSHRESFGMVFVEALLAGCPVVYPAGRAIEGYFENHSFAISAHPSRQEEITAAMRKLAVDERTLKASLALWLGTPAAARFQRDAISDAFSGGVREALSSSR
jgi:glycosyltransferase involved in cell wall biosynthesis